MPIHFTPEELASRRRATISHLIDRGLNGLLMFRQESMYYLTGYDTFGYVFFQCMYLGVDGTLFLVTRAPDKHLAHYTSVIEDVRVWVDSPDANPAQTDLRPLLEEKGCRGVRLGIEWDAYGLTAHNGRRIEVALDGFCTLEDASDLVTRQRVVKSPAELKHVRRAAELADDALEEAYRLAAPGKHVNEILAAMQAAVLRGGGDYPGNEFVVGSGPASALGRYQSTRHQLSADDILAVEHAGVYRHYHVCLFHSIKIGKASPKHESMDAVSQEARQAVTAAMRPGLRFGDVFEAYAQIMEKHRRPRYNACGYGLGVTFAPNWMDWPMFYRDNPEEILPGMVLFYTGGVRDHSDDTIAVCGETFVITETGHERLSRLPLDYVRIG
jgi:Xaa-Pro dipeptidase